MIKIASSIVIEKDLARKLKLIKAVFQAKYMHLSSGKPIRNLPDTIEKLIEMSGIESEYELGAE